MTVCLIKNPASLEGGEVEAGSQSNHRPINLHEKVLAF